jgi:hypothetical protein
MFKDCRVCFGRVFGEGRSFCFPGMVSFVSNPNPVVVFASLSPEQFVSFFRCRSCNLNSCRLFQSVSALCLHRRVIHIVRPSISRAGCTSQGVFFGAGGSSLSSFGRRQVPQLVDGWRTTCQPKLSTWSSKL